MKIKRYVAASMRAALAQVRVEQGPDAVILSSRRVDDGVEVIAAVDYDEALFADATVKRAAQSATPEVAPPGVGSPRVATPGASAPETSAVSEPPLRAETPTLQPAPAPAPTPTPAPVSAPQATPAAATESGILVMQRELAALREMLHDELSHMSWNDKRLRDPLQARVLEDLTAMDLAPDIARALASTSPPHTSLKNPSHIPLALLVRHLPVVDKLTPVNGGVIAVVGPTGAGKTTTIAKLAARWSMQHGSRDLALVSTDGYRIGAREQLMTYARILGAPMHAANSGRELARVLERLKSKKLILIDTAGMGPRDVRLTEQLAALQLGAAGARVLLALPAHGERQALAQIVRSFASVAPTACILTKVDEAASLGAALSTSIRYKLPIAYLCNGQRVPEDLHSAHERRVWLVKTALKLSQDCPPRVDSHYFARHFGKAQAHV